LSSLRLLAAGNGKPISSDLIDERIAFINYL
jgi:hypothetical protein